MRFLSWNEFDIAVQTISYANKKKVFSGVYGFPRGGLCLAVAISHSLNIPLLYEPKQDSLIVDDVYETGSTLNQVRTLSGVSIYVWLSKVDPDWWNAVETTNSEEWLVFPWENRELAEIDEQFYRFSKNYS